MSFTVETEVNELPFGAEFMGTSSEEIAQALRSSGLWSKEGALRTDYVNRLREELDFSQVHVNASAVGVVQAGNQAFYSHCLAISKRAFDIITSERVRSICRAYFNEQPFKLTNQRIYQTHSEAHMPWHTDNNQQSGSYLSAKHQLTGLLFLAYLSDVTQNSFQVLPDSHHWSRKQTDVYFSDRFIEEKYGKDIVSFRCNRGALMICDIHLVHRAEPFRNRKYARETLLFQVDAVDPAMTGHGEQLLINPAFIKERSKEIFDFLGVGARADYPTFPMTSAETMTPRLLLRVQKRLLRALFKSVGKTLVKKMIPGAWLINLKRLKWRSRPESKADSEVC